MNPVPDILDFVWESGNYTGQYRPTIRAMLSKNVVQPKGAYRTILFGTEVTAGPGGGPIETPQDQTWWEIPNIRTCEIDRRLGTDAASMRLTIRNTLPPLADENLDVSYSGTGTPTRRELMDLGSPGYFTHRRGIAVDTDGLNPWAHDINEWVDLFIPNRLIKTFQGYGTDGAGNPSQDVNLVLTGIWLIDRVETTAAGDITIECRDLAKLAIEQKLYPPIIPVAFYPLEFCGDQIEVVLQDTLISSTGVSQNDKATHPTTFQDSSAAKQYGQNGSVGGHRATDAFDHNPGTYWRSLGHTTASGSDSYEWISMNLGGNLFNKVWFEPRYGGYKVYVSVRVGNVWQGQETIPYSPTTTETDNGSSIPFVHVLNVPPNSRDFVFVDIPTSIAGGPWQADEVRLTFTNLADTTPNDPTPGPYFAEIYQVAAGYAFVLPDQQVGEGGFFDWIPVNQQVEVVVAGNVKDYTDIVKILAATAGFFWPQTSAATSDPALARVFGNASGYGRVWGDFFYSGAFPVDPACIPPSFWDQKSVMDGINQIKEILGFIFMVDSTGGIQWRPPNIWRTGNYMRGLGYQGETSVKVVDEKNVLIDYGTTIDDQNLRSDIVVVSADDPSVHGSYQPGWAESEVSPATPPGTAVTDLALLGGQQRVMTVANYPFGTAADPNSKIAIDKFAFLVSLWIHWSYRKSRFRIPGNPAFEVDDQVRIYERTTSEVYVHYIEGYTSSMDLEAGTWFMDMDTHWLGNGPSEQWMVQSREMHPALFAYLRSIGQIPTEIEDDQSLFPDDWFLYQPPVVPTNPIRSTDDFSHLFPLPPDLVWPEPGDSVNDTGYITPPTGNLSGGSTLNCSNTAMFNHWGGNCGGAPKTRFLLQGAGTVTGQSSSIYVTVHTRSLRAWEALSDIMEQLNFKVKLGQTGGYVCRKIAGKSSWSNHSWGTAVDINWNDYPQGRRASPGDPIYDVAQRAVNLRTNNGKTIFRWGGVWSGSTQPDPMHFEVCCSASDLATGVNA